MEQEINYGLDKVTLENFRLNFFATGSYSCKCRDCGKDYSGDKRSVLCFKCALKLEQNENTKLCDIIELTEDYLQRVKTIIVVSKEVNAKENCIELIDGLVDKTLKILNFKETKND